MTLRRGEIGRDSESGRFFSGGAGSIGAERLGWEGHFLALLKCGEINHETHERNEKEWETDV